MIEESSQDAFYVMEALTDKGKKRSKNEDYFGIFQPESEEGLDTYGILAVVADGMSGTFVGYKASRMAVETISSVYFKSEEGGARERLREAFEAANERILNELAGGRELTTGTTCTAAVFLGDRLYIGHAGDSRGYLIQEGRIEQLTRDHSEVWEAVQRGEMSMEEARRDPRRNVLTSSIGMTSEFFVDVTGPIEIVPSDRVLLCTDGLTNMLDDSEILKIAAGEEPKKACARLVKAANRAGGKDNITVIIAERAK